MPYVPDSHIQLESSHADLQPAVLPGIFVMKRNKKSDIEEFVAMSAAEKQHVFTKLDAETPEQSLARSRPLNASERRQWRRFKAKMGRPKIGKGAKTISLTMEKDLLKQADAYAKRHKISRAQLVAKGLKAILGSAA
jgi:hypothetical protein